VLGAAHGVGRVQRHDLADDEPIEEHADGGQVLLHGRLGMGAAELLDVAGDVDRLDPLQVREAFVLAPGRELRDGDVIGFAGIPVADVDGEKFPEALAVGFGAQIERLKLWQPNVTCSCLKEETTISFRMKNSEN
jgi:hypothetical protein